MSLGNWLANNILDDTTINQLIEDFCSSRNIDTLISENKTTAGFDAVDDGPRYFWGNQASYKKATKKQAEKLGMKVLDYISGNEEIFNLDKDTKFPDGPTGAVSYFPVGLPGVRSGTNLFKDKKGKAAFDRWVIWSKYLATSVGYEFVNFLGSEEAKFGNKKEPIKKQKQLDHSPEIADVEALKEQILLHEGINDKHIFKAIFLAGGPGSGKSSVVDSIFNNPDQKQIKSLTSTGLKVVNLDRAYEYLKKKHKLPVGAEDMDKEQNSLSGKLMHKARMIAQKQMEFYIEGKLGIIIDGTGGSYNPIAKKKAMLEDLGYDCYMIFVDTTMKTAMERNANRDTRRLLDKVVKRNWKSVQQNKSAYKSLFGSNMKVVSTEGRQPGELPRGAKSHVMKFINTAIQNPIAKKWIGIAKKVLK